MLCEIQISSTNLIHNHEILSKIAGRSQIIPVLKSNAYGHGIKQVLKIFMDHGLQWLSVNYFKEAVFLRDQGYQGRIFVMGQLEKQEVVEAEKLNVDIFITKKTVFEQWVETEKKPRIHLKIDTGMARQGFFPSEISSLLPDLVRNRNKIAGLCSHFANVEDVLDHSYAQHQLKNLQGASQICQDAGIQVPKHIASSASSLILPASRLDYCRVGISTYGLWPSSTTRLSYFKTYNEIVDLKPVLKWITKIAIIKRIQKGQSVGYGCTFKATTDMTIGVLPIGYSEGFPRIAGNAHSYVLVAGQRCPIIGRVCMNMVMIDLSHLDQPHEGQRVVLIGEDGEEQIDAETLASWSSTIHYEILTKLHPEIPRTIV